MIAHTLLKVAKFLGWDVDYSPVKRYTGHHFNESTIMSERETS